MKEEKFIKLLTKQVFGTDVLSSHESKEFIERVKKLLLGFGAVDRLIPAEGVGGMLEDLIEGPGIDLIKLGTKIKVGMGGDRILLLDSGGDPIAEYTTLATANTAMTSGDILKIPAGSYSGDVTQTAGGKWVGESRYATILTGEITGADGSTLENLTISRTANDGNTLKGVIMAVVGTVYLNGVDVILAQSGAGDARALSSEVNSAIIEAWNCYLNGDSTSGSGWARWRDTGTTASTYVYGGRAVGSTTPANAF